MRGSIGGRDSSGMLTAIVVFLGLYLLWSALRAANHAWSTPTVGKSILNFFFGSGIPCAIYTAWMLLLVWPGPSPWPASIGHPTPAGLATTSSVLASTLWGAEQNTPQHVRVRLSKRERLLESGAEPYPAGFARTATTVGLRARYGDLAPDTSAGEVVSVAGG